MTANNKVSYLFALTLGKILGITLYVCVAFFVLVESAGKVDDTTPAVVEYVHRLYNDQPIAVGDTIKAVNGTPVSSIGSAIAAIRLVRPNALHLSSSRGDTTVEIFSSVFELKTTYLPIGVTEALQKSWSTLMSFGVAFVEVFVTGSNLFDTITDSFKALLYLCNSPRLSGVMSSLSLWFAYAALFWISIHTSVMTLIELLLRLVREKFSITTSTVITALVTFGFLAVSLRIIVLMIRDLQIL